VEAVKTNGLRHVTFLLHTQEVTGSSPVAPTIHFNQIQERSTRKLAHCDVDCDVTPNSSRCLIGLARKQRGAAVQK
jgi:hypothetical protein